MNSLALRTTIAETMDEVFAPPPGASVADLLAERETKRAIIERTADLLAGDGRRVIEYFLRGNVHSDRYSNEAEVARRLFGVERAVKALDAECWDRVLKLTDVLDVMPQGRCDEWYESIRTFEVPPFDESTVFATLAELLASRKKFFAERVDGVFRALSGEHVTNSPTGFRKRMIFGYVIGSFGYVDCSRAGVIEDLRKVISRFMGRGEPSYNSTSKVIGYAYRECTGQWVSVDGGSFRLRAYLKGTVHIEVHPEIAYRLNNVLAYMYPSAIASKHRQRPKRKSNVRLFERPLPFAVVNELVSFDRFSRVEYDELGRARRTPVPNAVRHGGRWSDLDKHLRQEITQVMYALGATDGECSVLGEFEFDYPPYDVIAEVVASGCLPDERAYQYYPTPPHIAQRVAELAGLAKPLTPNDVQDDPSSKLFRVLEPSAGQGALVEALGQAEITCVEASSLHCSILRQRDFDVVEGDFLEVEPSSFGMFDCVVMNPPFSQGRWQAHLAHAAEFVREGGNLAAVLPASARGKNVLPGWSCEWHEQYAFPGTSIEVVLLRAVGGAR